MAFSFETIFPVPDILRMPAMGFDISDSHIKYLELVRTRNGVHIGRYGMQEIPKGVIVEGSITDVDALSQVVATLQQTLDIRLVRASLPEKKVYLFDVTIPRIPEKKIPEALLYQIEEHIPLKKTNLVFDYAIISEDERTYHIQVHALEKSVATSYVTALTQGGCAPLSFELEPQAVTRALNYSEIPQQFMLVDIGETHTSISIIRSSVVVFTTTVALDFAQLSKDVNACIAKFPKKDTKETLPDDCITAIQKHLEPLVAHIKKYNRYWETHTASTNNSIEKILLSGAGAHIKGMTTCLSDAIGSEVVPAPVWNRPRATGDHSPLSFDEVVDYSVAIGLARTDFLYD